MTRSSEILSLSDQSHKFALAARARSETCGIAKLRASRTDLRSNHKQGCVVIDARDIGAPRVLDGVASCPIVKVIELTDKCHAFTCEWSGWRCVCVGWAGCPLNLDAQAISEESHFWPDLKAIVDPGNSLEVKRDDVVFAFAQNVDLYCRVALSYTGDGAPPRAVAPLKVPVEHSHGAAADLDRDRPRAIGRGHQAQGVFVHRHGHVPQIEGGAA